MPGPGGLQQRSELGALGLYLGDHHRAYMGLAEGVEPQTMNGIDFGLTATTNWMAFA
jgi:hypothetical protein